jgi:16S rRNA (uracil1498-N3)-methyltransferase
MTTVFYAPPDRFSGGFVDLPEDEARHASRVLRHGVGDELVVVDGAGGRHRARIVGVDRQRVRAEVVETVRMAGEPAFRLVIGAATLKNATRFETLVEKAVELGVAAIVPLATERTERDRARPTRLHNIMVAAMKQSGRCVLPDLREQRALDDVIAEAPAGLRLICHEAAAPESNLLARLAREQRLGDVTVLVGPEGGFSDAEIERAGAVGWEVVSLGERRLRAETAGIVVAAAVALHAGR